MKLIFAGQVPKELEYPEENEDAFTLGSNSDILIISDGASESFDSRTWARLLVESPIEEADLDQTILTAAITNYKSQYDFSTMSWSKQAAYKRGSYASLLIVKQINADTIKLYGVGDSFVVLLNKGELSESFPYIQTNQFRQRPVLLGTNATHNNFLGFPDFVSRCKKIWTITDKVSPTLLCMTDAIGEWALRNWEEGNPVWQQLIDLKELTELENLVIVERQKKNMRVDDTTFIHLSLKDRFGDELPNS